MERTKLPWDCSEAPTITLYNNLDTVRVHLRPPSNPLWSFPLGGPTMTSSTGIECWWRRESLPTPTRRVSASPSWRVSSRWSSCRRAWTKSPNSGGWGYLQLCLHPYKTKTLGHCVQQWLGKASLLPYLEHPMPLRISAHAEHRSLRCA